ncbi:hypothetical protein [Actinomadura chokoriensis]|uniref:M64 family metallopeptidase n=1 Tax=Actinomadura chokoriensis TaxID=454156 RepID=A0ABV4R373_9ACTN
MTIPGIVLFPHCDLHMALAGTPPLLLRVFDRIRDPANARRYKLTELLPAPTVPYEVDFFAPHNVAGHRFDDLPVFDRATRRVTAAKPGVYLFQVRRGQFYQVGRLQVHNQILAWWFGNDSITTALDPAFAHAQPSIYAKFSDDAGTGTDLIGDITGHQYFPLTSAAPGTVQPTPDGRLRGAAESAAPVKVSGTFLGQSHDLDVRVVNYAKPNRRELEPIRTPAPGRAAELHNIVFVAEGFRASEQAKFNSIVTQTEQLMFTKARHEPYPSLKGSFNVFKAFAASQEHGITCGFQVTDTDVAGVTAGSPIPWPYHVDPEKKDSYTLEELVLKVGLPMRNESRPNLPDLWNGQSLDNFERTKVDPKLLEAWKVHRSTGILHTRDTFFGMHFGSRLADRDSGFSRPAAVTPPGADTAGPALSAFVKRLYEFYDTEATRVVSLDPRRHPPELFAGFTDPDCSIVSYLRNLEFTLAPFPLIGPQWEPDDQNFKRSRGLVVLVVNDNVSGGANVNNNTLTALACNEALTLPFKYANPADKREMRRDPPASITVNQSKIVNTVTHELGHSFNLGDEYEEFNGDDGNATLTDDLTHDNVARLGAISFGPAANRKVDPAKVKWFELLRMRLSDRLLVDSTAVPGGIQVSIDRGQIAKWVKAKQENAQVHLRRFRIGPTGQQLPLKPDTIAGEYAHPLDIVSINEAQGTMVLGGSALGLPPPVFVAGSCVFVPLLRDDGQPHALVERKVREHIEGVGGTGGTHDPLNSDTNHVKTNDEADGPVSISGFKGPCKGSKLIGIYEGGERFAGANYRSTGACKMRSSGEKYNDGEFCFVCKWLIVNRVDPGQHTLISEKFYPEAKRHG